MKKEVTIIHIMEDGEVISNIEGYISKVEQIPKEVIDLILKIKGDTH
ncbi:MAG: hypothetical protein ACRCW1_01475 [Anaerotignaceae bacterium]